MIQLFFGESFFFLLFKECGLSHLHAFSQYLCNRVWLPDVTLHSRLCDKGTQEAVESRV